MLAPSPASPVCALRPFSAEASAVSSKCSAAAPCMAGGEARLLRCGCLVLVPAPVPARLLDGLLPSLARLRVPDIGRSPLL